MFSLFQFLNDGKVASQKKRFVPFYEKLPSWENHILKTERFRNQGQVRTRLMAQYGEVRSFLVIQCAIYIIGHTTIFML